MEIDKSIFYDMNNLMSYNALYNFVLGERGNGKTYQGKKKMINLWVKEKKQSIYVRRSAEEIKEVKDTLFNDIAKDFPDLKIEVKGYQGFIDDELFCYFIPLSTSSKYKSASYPLVDFIFFDEYILTKNGRNNYLKNEMVLLNDLVETVFRLRDPRVYICSNAVSYVNPFFSYFGIEPKPNDRFIKIPQKGVPNIVVELTDTKDYRATKKKSRFAQMLEGTEYASYSIDNNALEDTDDFIISKKPVGFNCFLGAFRVGSQIIGGWYNGSEHDSVWFDTKYEPKSHKKFTVYSNENYEGWTNIKVAKNHSKIIYLKKAYLEGGVYYSKQEVKKLFIESISKFL